MSKAIRLVLKGENAVARSLRQFERRKLKRMETALVAGAKVILEDAKELVPVDTGALRASGVVEPVTKDGGKIRTGVSFGGGGVDYAIDVHEDPAQEDRKYLERAEKARRSEVRAAIRKEAKD